jgi:hypothetical protein
MGIDHTNDGADENVERATPADRGSPLPRDRPGADAYPSRADGRDGAAAANDTQNNGGRSEEKPGRVKPPRKAPSETTASPPGTIMKRRANRI